MSNETYCLRKIRLLRELIKYLMSREAFCKGCVFPRPERLGPNARVEQINLPILLFSYLKYAEDSFNMRSLEARSMIQSSFFEAGNGGVLDCAILYRSTTVLLHPLLWENRHRLSSSCGGKLPPLCRQHHNRRLPVCNAAKLNEAL